MRGLQVAICSLAIVGCHSPTNPATDGQTAAKANAPQPSGTIGGTVRGPDRAIAGAQVCAHRGGPAHEPICASTDAAGHYTLSVGSGLFVVVAAADGLVPRGEHVHLREQEPGVIEIFDLAPGGRRYEGVVLDIDGRPIVGATISHARPRVDVDTVVETRTDAQGNFALWSARGGELRARAPGYAREAIATPDQRRLVLLPESTISGVVVDPEGKTVAGALVWLGQLESPPTDAVQTDEHGRFRLTQLAAGEHPISVTSTSRGARHHVEVGFAEQREDVVLTLDRALSRHRARVVDVESGAAVAGCRLQLSSNGWTGVEGSTDEMGLFERPLQGEYLLSAVECPGYVASRPFRPIGPDLPSPTPVEVRQGATVHGTVLDDAQQPVAGVQVSLEPTYEGESGLYRPPRALTDGKGRFSITGLPAAEFAYVIHDSVDAHAHVMTHGGQLVYQELQIPSAGGVEIEVGADWIGAYVRLLACNGQAVEMTWSSEVDSDRLAVFERVPVGTYQLDAPSVSWERAVCSDAKQRLSVTARTTTRLRVDFGPHEQHTCDVLVLDQHDAPVAGAVVGLAVSWWLPADQWRFHRGNLLLTDASGRAALPCKSTTSVGVIAARPGLRGVQLTNTGLDEVLIRLQPIDSP